MIFHENKNMKKKKLKLGERYYPFVFESHKNRARVPRQQSLIFNKNK